MFNKVSWYPMAQSSWCIKLTITSNPTSSARTETRALYMLSVNSSTGLYLSPHLPSFTSEAKGHSSYYHNSCAWGHQYEYDAQERAFNAQPWRRGSLRRRGPKLFFQCLWSTFAPDMFSKHPPTYPIRFFPHSSPSLHLCPIHGSGFPHSSFPILFFTENKFHNTL